MTVRIAEIHAVDHQGGFHALHAHILKADVIDHGILTASAPGFDPEAAVIAAHQTMVHPDIADSAGHLAADGDAAMAVQHGAPGDFNILAGKMVFLTHVDFSGLDGDTVISDGKTGAPQPDTSAALGIKAIRVRADSRGFHPDIDEGQIFTENGMQVPGRAVAEGEALNRNSAAADKIEQMPAVSPVFAFGICPPAAFQAAPVHNAFSREAHILYLHAGEGGGKVIQRIALPGTQQQILPLAGGPGDAGQDGMTIPIREHGKGRAALQLYGDMAAEKQGTAGIGSRRQQHPAACRTAADGSLQRSGVIGYAITPGAETAHIEGEAFRLRVKGKGIIRPVFPADSEGILRIRLQIEQGKDRAVFLPQREDW